MALIALVAVLVGVVATSGFVRRIRDASVWIEGASLWIRLDLVPDSDHGDDGGMMFVPHSFFFQVPLPGSLLLGTIAATPIGLAVYLSARRRRRAAPRRGDGPGA
jgi:hypothetical protein